MNKEEAEVTGETKQFTTLTGGSDERGLVLNLECPREYVDIFKQILKLSSRADHDDESVKNILEAELFQRQEAILLNEVKELITVLLEGRA